MFHEAVVIGASAGGLVALKVILPALSTSFPLAVAIVQHREERADGYFADCLTRICEIPVKEAEDKEPFRPGHIYLAPAGYHLLVEPDRSFSLSMDPRVNYARPSIDVLFESAAEAFGAALIGVVLTGANADGAAGLHAITERGGLAIVQNPENAVAGAMPRAALAATRAHHVAELEQIAPLLMNLSAAGEAAYVANG
jgi:two-component system, chemotaxis family, protein-glutamate methylesterase/glutaminase